MSDKQPERAAGAALDRTLAAFRAHVERCRWTIRAERPIQGGLQLVISDGIQENPVSFYASGKALIQGKPGELFQELQGWWQQQRGAAPGEAALPLALGIARAGLDESGKGDYFGPLVVAAAYVDGGVERRLLELGVQDSKRLSDQQATRLAAAIRELAPHAVVTISPKRYNELYQQIGNLNALLAWGHARALESLLERVDCDYAIADQFGDERFLRDALLEKGRRIKLDQRPRGEQDLAVAAASILARAEFVGRLEQLSRQVGSRLPKGASDPAILERGRALVASAGREALAQVAKLHFKTTQQILG